MIIDRIVVLSVVITYVDIVFEFKTQFLIYSPLLHFTSDSLCHGV